MSRQTNPRWISVPEHQVPLTSPQIVGTFMGSSALRNQTRCAPVHSNPILSEILSQILSEILSTSFFHILFYIHLSSIFFHFLPFSSIFFHFLPKVTAQSVPLCFCSAGIPSGSTKLVQFSEFSQSSLRVLSVFLSSIFFVVDD